jgi:hypothetical protein
MKKNDFNEALKDFARKQKNERQQDVKDSPAIEGKKEQIDQAARDASRRLATASADDALLLALTDFANQRNSTKVGKE